MSAYYTLLTKETDNDDIRHGIFLLLTCLGYFFCSSNDIIHRNSVLDRQKVKCCNGPIRIQNSNFTGGTEEADSRLVKIMYR